MRLNVESLKVLILATLFDVSVTFSFAPSKLFTIRSSRWLGSKYAREIETFMATLEPSVVQSLDHSSSVSPSSPSVASNDRLIVSKTRQLEINQENVSTLLIDNYDSYTYNIWQLLHQVNGVEPYVVYNDEFNSWREMLESVPHFDNIVISPGPGTPLNQSDFGLCKDAIIESTVPVLGVCLGHQGIAHIFDLDITRSGRPVHGEIFPVHHVGGDKSSLFKGIPNGFGVVRYHSLVVQDPDRNSGANGVGENSPIRVTAWTEDGEVMALEHSKKPIYGVQFHPESVLSTYGHQLLSNFRDITLEDVMRRQHIGEAPRPKPITPNYSGRSNTESFNKYDIDVPMTQMSNIHVSKLHLPPKLTFEDVFFFLYHVEGDEDVQNGGGSFWLDSSLVNKTETRPSLSFAGAVNAQNQGVSIEYRHAKSPHNTALPELIVRSSDGEILSQQENGATIFDYIHEFTHQAKISGNDVVICDDTCRGDELPFAARRSLFGYIGYEARHEARERLQGKRGNIVKKFSPLHSSDYPTSLYLCPRQFLVYDHGDHAVYIVTASSEKTLPEDVYALKEQILNIPEKANTPTKMPQGSQELESGECTNLEAIKSADAYFHDVERCIEYIRAGETYEVCMTVQFTGKCHHKPADIYRKLRKNNPAPYSCFLKYKSYRHDENGGESRNGHGGEGHDFTICCSSPERYLRMNDGGIIDSKPIKGTSRRNNVDAMDDIRIAEELASDVKSRAENLMIVDLVRNDLGRVCERGSIHVPQLMKVETYATVHQLVSTIEGKLDREKGYSFSDAICATFPGGSMTGAPKLRTMEIIDDLEGRPRGVYSGTIGYIGSDGSADMNIVIRTAVISKEQITVGAGGAVTALSDPQEEVEEVLLKVNAVANSIGYRAMFKDSTYYS